MFVTDAAGNPTRYQQALPVKPPDDDTIIGGDGAVYGSDSALSDDPDSAGSEHGKHEHLDYAESEGDPDPSGQPQTADEDVDEPRPANPVDPFLVDWEFMQDMPSVEKDWPYEFIEFAGHQLGVRLPDQAAMTGFSMGTQPSVPEAMRNNTVGGFAWLHLSRVSHWFLIWQLMNPDASEFGEDAFNDVIKMLFELGVEKVKAEMEALAARDRNRRPVQRPPVRQFQRPVQRQQPPQQQQPLQRPGPRQPLS
jgi:hypothetical protein